MNKLFILSLVLPIIDYIYLYNISSTFNEQVSDIQKSNLQVKLLPAILCYVLILFSLNHFVLLKGSKVKDAFILGLTTYGIFDLTNKAIFENYRWDIVVKDMIWGAFLYSISIYLTNNISNNFII